MGAQTGLTRRSSSSSGETVVFCNSRTRGRSTMRRFLGVAALIGVVWPAAAGAQAVKGSLVGNITDQGGLAMPGVTVTITETSTNISYSTTTLDNGSYTFPSLKDGTYKVVAELSGFKRVIR